MRQILTIKDMIAWIEKQKPIDWDEYDEMYVSALIASRKRWCNWQEPARHVNWLVVAS